MAGCRPSRVFSRVDLPEPFAPRMAVKLPRWIENEIADITGWLL